MLQYCQVENKLFSKLTGDEPGFNYSHNISPFPALKYTPVWKFHECRVRSIRNEHSNLIESLSIGEIPLEYNL